MTQNKILAVGTVLAAICLMIEPPYLVLAQEHDPAERTALLIYASGSVSSQLGRSDWVRTIPGQLLTTGDNLWADQNSRAEIQVDSALVGVGSETSITVLNVGDHTTQLKLALGSVIVRVMNFDAEEVFTVVTPNLAFAVHAAGEYRVDVNASGDLTDITVWRGHGTVSGGGATYILEVGQWMRFSGADQLQQEIGPPSDPDDFDQWAFSRNQQEQLESVPSGSPETAANGEAGTNGEAGADDNVHDSGHWQYIPGFGLVWEPTVWSEWEMYPQLWSPSLVLLGVTIDFPFTTTNHLGSSLASLKIPPGEVSMRANTTPSGPREKDHRQKAQMDAHMPTQSALPNLRSPRDTTNRSGQEPRSIHHSADLPTTTKPRSQNSHLDERDISQRSQGNSRQPQSH